VCLKTNKNKNKSNIKVQKLKTRLTPKNIYDYYVSALYFRSYFF